MRILHTSDWHLGRSFGQVPLLDDQAAFVEWLLDVVAQERIELVVIAGDLYDRAIPPIESVALFRHALTTLVSRGIKVVAVAGNHDSPERVSSADGLTDAAGIVIRGGYARAGETITLAGSDGPLDVVLVPFLEPSMAPPPTLPPTAAPSIGPSIGPTARPWGATTSAEVQRPDQQSVLTAALARRTVGAPRSVVVAHAFVTGGQPSDSERMLSVGGSGTVSAGTFDGFSYVALGHLHRPQFVGHHTRRYSGSPLPYSFSEQHDKHVVVVDIDPLGTCRTNHVTVPVGRHVVTLTGSIDELLDDPRHAPNEHHFVRAVLTDADYVLDAKARLMRRFDHVTEIVLRPATPGAASASTEPAPQRSDLTPLAATHAFWRDVTNRNVTSAESGELERLLAAAAAHEATERAGSLG